VKRHEVLLRDCTPKEYRIDWRASLVPAAAVIPAPVAHIIVAAVKTSVVDHKIYSDTSVEMFSVL
jgi:hypothetical protein